MCADMELGGRPGEIAIGAALARARERAGFDLAEAERRTKIRRRYLAALEDERWSELPSAAYAKGFLRTYAELLDLDAELLVDEYRRQVESSQADADGVGEIVLEHRPRRGSHARRVTPTTIALGVVAVVAVVIGLILLTGGDDDEVPPLPGTAEREGKRQRAGRAASKGELVRLELRVSKPVEVCLLGAGGKELIDGQLLSAGSSDAFASERFALRFPSGFDRDRVRLKLNGKVVKLPRVEGPAAMVITPPREVRQASRPKQSCP